MKCGQCSYLNKGPGSCAVCGFQMTKEIEKKPYQIPRQSKKQTEIKAKDIEFYKQCFAYSNQKCEECELNLGEQWRPEYVSHILTKQYKKFRWDFRNHNILCFDCHQIWEFGKRQLMKIYKKNLIIIQELMEEYYPNKK